MTNNLDRLAAETLDVRAQVDALAHLPTKPTLAELAKIAAGAIGTLALMAATKAIL